MTTPLKLPVNDQDGVELEKIGDHVSDGRLLLFTPLLIRLYTAWMKLLLVRTTIGSCRVSDCSGACQMLVGEYIFTQYLFSSGPNQSKKLDLNKSLQINNLAEVLLSKPPPLFTSSLTSLKYCMLMVL